jgi:hypothetical protein
VTCGSQNSHHPVVRLPADHPVIPICRPARAQGRSRRARAPAARLVLDRTEHGGTLHPIETS